MEDKKGINGFSPLDSNSNKLLTEIQKKAITKLTKLMLNGERNMGILTSETNWKDLFLPDDHMLKDMASMPYWIEKIESKIEGEQTSNKNTKEILPTLKVTSLESLKLRMLEIAHQGIDNNLFSKKQHTNPDMVETMESVKGTANKYLNFVYDQFLEFSIKSSDKKLSYELKLKTNDKETKEKADEIIRFVMNWSYEIKFNNKGIPKIKSTKYSRDLLKLQTTSIEKQLKAYPEEKEQQLRKIQEIIKAKNKEIKPLKSRSSKYDLVPKKLVLKDGEFTDDELKAVISIMILINKSKDRQEFKSIDSSISYFNLNITEFNRYFGVPTTKRGSDQKVRFTGRKSEEAKQALLKVSKKIIATHFEKKSKSLRNKNVKGKMITEIMPIINPLKVSVNGEYELGDQLPLEEGEITIAVNRIFFENIGESGNFFFIPENINLEITTAGGGKRVAAGVRNFGVWIHSITPKKDRTWEVTYPKLIDILWLQKYYKEKRKNLIEKNIKTAFDNAIARGILEKVTEGISAEGHKKYILQFTELYINNR